MTKFFHLYAQPVGLAGEKGAGTGGAECIHSVIHHHAVFQQNDFAVLSADLKNGADIRVQRSSAHSVGCNLIFHHGCAHHCADKPPGAAGGAYGHHSVVLLVELLLQQFQQAAYRFDRVAFCPDVFAGQKAVVLIDDNTLGGN